MNNRMLKLARRPKGMAEPSDFAIEEGPVPEPGDNEFSVRVDVLSLDPAMRGWMNDGPSYVPPVQIGEVMRAFGGGVVQTSRHPDFPEGSSVVGLFGVQRYALSNGAGVARVDVDRAPIERWVGGLGMPGQTAYFGLLDIGDPKPGETVTVSAASGAVGQVVGQIAKIKGARAVGIAGGPDKCRFLIEELGFDAAVDYKREDFASCLADATPDGIDVYFENVGGPISDACYARMNRGGRVAVCGLIHYYNAARAMAGPSPGVMRSILVNRLTVRGFIVFDFAKRIPEAVEALAGWHAGGKLKMREDVREGGVEAFCDTLNDLFVGKNFGKLVLKL